MSTEDAGLWLRCRISREPQPLPGATAGAPIVRRPEEQRQRAVSLILKSSRVTFPTHTHSLSPSMGEFNIFWTKIVDLDGWGKGYFA